MPPTEVRSVTPVESATFNLQWAPIIAGGVAAAAVALILHSFAVAMGLAVSSTSPTWRDSSVALVLLTGLYLLLAAIAAYGVGGYIAARTRSASVVRTPEDTEFQDGLHGLLAWAVATLVTA